MCPFSTGLFVCLCVFVGKISSCWGWSVQVPVAIVLLISPLYFFEIHRWSGDLETHADTKRQRRWQTCNQKGLSAIVAFLFSFKWKTELGCSSFMAGNWVEGIAFSLFYNLPFFLLLCHLMNWCTGKQYLPKEIIVHLLPNFFWTSFIPVYGLSIVCLLLASTCWREAVLPNEHNCMIIKMV